MVQQQNLSKLSHEAKTMPYFQHYPLTYLTKVYIEDCEFFYIVDWVILETWVVNEKTGLEYV